MCHGDVNENVTSKYNFALKKLRRGLRGECHFKIELCSRLSVLRLFHVDRVVRNGPSVLSFDYHE